MQNDLTSLFVCALNIAFSATIIFLWFPSFAEAWTSLAVVQIIIALLILYAEGAFYRGLRGFFPINLSKTIFATVIGGGLWGIGIHPNYIDNNLTSLVLLCLIQIGVLLILHFAWRRR